MRIRALVLDACRELVYRKTLLFYFGIVTLTHLLLLLALETDAANGLITSVRIFGMEGHAQRGGFQMDNQSAPGALLLDPATLVRGIEVTVAWILYPMGIMLSVFATASLVPRMLERGSIDLLLSKPVSRPALFAARWLGAFAVAAANLVYLVGGVGIILGIKVGIWNWGFLLSGLMMAAYFGALLGYLALIGILLRSTTVGIMMTAAIYFASLIVHFPHANRDWPMLITGRIARFGVQAVVEVLYHALPRTYDFGRIVTGLILERPVESWAPVGGTLLSGAAALLVAVLVFRRTDF
jgi:ABC-type transport system involved in multi-copper enzyme maturation permease subunit